MSSYVKRAMQPDENVVYAAQLHWIIYKNGIIFTIFGALFSYFGVGIAHQFLSEESAAVVEGLVKNISIGIILLGALQLVIAYIRQISTELVITDRRVIAKHGLVATTSYELMMSKVEGATIDQTVIGRILGYGIIMVKGTGGGISPIDHIAKPFVFHGKLMETMRTSPDNHRNG